MMPIALSPFKFADPRRVLFDVAREIGNVDEGIVEGGEDTGNAEDELA